MLTSSEFVDFHPWWSSGRVPSSSAAVAAALPKELDGFDTEEVEAPAGEQGTSSFARQLLLATRFFGQPEDVSRNSLIAHRGRGRAVPPGAGVLLAEDGGAAVPDIALRGVDHPPRAARDPPRSRTVRSATSTSSKTRLPGW